MKLQSQKDEKTGAVVYYPDLCVGCRYCLVACPYSIPKYQWDEQFPQVAKCQMCEARVEKGDAPACVSACTTGALISGDRDELIKKAHEIINSDSRYVIDALQKGWAWGWKKKNWVKSDKKPALNPDLWDVLLSLTMKHELRYHWVKGHAENPKNNRCDELAVAEWKKLK